MRGYWGLLCSVLAIGCGSLRANEPVTVGLDLYVEHYRLTNGLEVVVHEDSSFRDVAVNLRYRVGSGDDPEGKSGTAHLVEHLMFRGSVHTDGNPFQESLDALTPAIVNGATSFDTTEYSTLVPAQQLSRVLWLEADRMASLGQTVSASGFRAERDVVKNEWRQQHENRPLGNLYIQIARALFPPQHRYHRPTIGTPKELESISLEDAQGFLKRHYAPQNATLVIVGPVRSSVVRGLVAEYFGHIPNGSGAPTSKNVAFEVMKDTRLVTMNANVSSHSVTFAWKVPPPSHASWYPLQFGLNVLTRRLFYDFVSQMSIASDVGIACHDARLAAICTITIALIKPISTASLVSVVDQRMGGVPSSIDLNWATVSEVRTQFLTKAILEVGHPSRRADVLQDGLEHFGNVLEAKKNLKRIDAVTPDEAESAMEQYLKPGKVVVTIQPDPGAPPGGTIQ